MLDVETTNRGVRAIDHANVEVSVESPDWTPVDVDADIPRPIDGAIVGVASELRLPAGHVSVRNEREEDHLELGDDRGPLELDDGRYLIDISTALKTYVGFDGKATVRKTADFGSVILEFPERRSLTLGFRSRHQRPAATITTRPSPAGLATALSHVHSSIKTTSPDRSFPTLRGHPPRLRVGDRTSVPEELIDETSETGIEFVVPPDWGTLYVLAPLVYYLQATVSIGDLETPRLQAHSCDVDHELPSTPELQDETASLLRHVFYLDCLVRNSGPYGSDIAEMTALDENGLNAGEVYRQSPAQRLSEYLSVPREMISPYIPDWHLSTYVSPDSSRVRSLPYLLDNMSLIYLPETTELSGSELLERSLSDFYRLSQDTTVADVEVVKPSLGHGRVHGWLADGIPIEVFKATHAAFENRLDYLERAGGDVDVVVVLNDDDMAGERDTTADVYRERAEELPMSVTVRRNLRRDKLTTVFQEHNAFVHYIGHCEESGLRCPDGTLGASDIAACNTQTFFLNACGSYHEGMELVNRGAVAGAVTFNEVLDKQAATVGTTFARLLVQGFSFGRSIQLARRRIMAGKDYAVVGDGTYSLTQSESLVPHLYHVERTDSGFELTCDALTTRTTGGIYYLHLGNQRRQFLYGTESQYQISRDELLDFLGRTNGPVMYEDSFLWPSELFAELTD